MFQPVDTRIPSEVESEVRKVYLRMFPSGDRAFLPRAFGWADQCFTGRYKGYLAVDARYHDFEHTLQGTLCLARLLDGRDRAEAEPRLTQRGFELALLAILFHDTGYLKQQGDASGTGAKYTLTHVARSAAFAREFLSKQGYEDRDLQAVQHMIRCTGVTTAPQAISFQDELERILGYALGTSDLLGQMAASDYVDKLPVLFQEFAEAVEFTGDQECRLAAYHNAEDLMRNTPAFFETYVLPRIQRDFGALYRFLNDPYPEGPNPYLVRIGENLDRLKRKLEALSKR